jgi:hypothetical protein
MTLSLWIWGIWVDLLTILYTPPYKPDGSVADPDPGSGAFLTPGSGMNNPVESLNLTGLKKYLNSLMRIQIRNLFDPGSGIQNGKIRIWINTLDPQHSLIDHLKSFCELKTAIFKKSLIS